MKKFMLLLVSVTLATILFSWEQDETISNKEVPVEEQISNDTASVKVPAKPRRKGTVQEKPKEEQCEIAESALS